MGEELYGSDPIFKESFDRACEELDQHLDKPLKEIVFATGKKAQALLDDTTYAQPALFAIEVALFEALSKRGLEPDLLAGHSIGEIAAAHVAGVLDLQDAAKLVAARGRLMGALPKGGAMAAIEATEVEVAGSIAGREGELAIAAVNGPTSIVISGAEGAVEEIRAQWEEQGRRTKQLSVSHAFHSPLMEPMLGEFGEVASSLTYSDPEIPIVSNVSGELLSAEQATDPAYWVRNVREPVRFADAVGTLREEATGTYVELGPDAVLCSMARECLADDEVACVPTLREGRPEADAVSTAIAAAHAAGASVEWSAFFAGSGAKRVPLPTYPFQRKHYWLPPAAGTADPSAFGLTPSEHPLLGAMVELADGKGEGLLLTGRLSLQAQPWLADHAYAGVPLLSAAAFLDLALWVAEQVDAGGVEELALEAPLTLPPEGAIAIRISISGRDEDGLREIAIHSRPDGEDGEWTLNSRGTLTEREVMPTEPLAEWPPEGAEPLALEPLQDRRAEHGLEHGPALQGPAAAWRDGETIYIEASLPEEIAEEATRFGIHPALLDSALAGIGFTEGDAEGVELPSAWAGVGLHRGGSSALRLRIVPAA
ncbi:MAG: acyltransferase domain-containing protein, partial [Solirubrobacterales bacterium]